MRIRPAPQQVGLIDGMTIREMTRLLRKSPTTIVKYAPAG
jgi:hypothetical protein